MHLLLSLALQHWLARVGEFLHSFVSHIDGPGLLLVALADSSFLSIPEGNDVLIVVLSTGKTWGRMAYYVMMTVAGSVTGCVLLYFVGRKGGSPLLRRKFSPSNVARAERLFDRYGAFAVAVPSILPPPCPFKIFVFSAGVFRLNLPAFLIAVAVGRTIRYSMWGILAVLYGTTVKIYMEQNLPRIGTLLLVILAGIVLFLIYRSFFRSTGRSTDLEGRD